MTEPWTRIKLSSLPVYQKSNHPLLSLPTPALSPCLFVQALESPSGLLPNRFIRTTAFWFLALRLASIVRTSYEEFRHCGGDGCNVG